MLDPSRIIKTCSSYRNYYIDTYYKFTLRLWYKYYHQPLAEIDYGGSLIRFYNPVPYYTVPVDVIQEFIDFAQQYQRKYNKTGKEPE